MKYIALFRGINVGGHRKVEMKRLKALFENMGYKNIATYKNSGNALFESPKTSEELSEEIEKNLKEEFGFEVRTIIKSREEMTTIARAIPDEWQNDKTQKTDVAFLFPKIDSEETIDRLPINRDVIDVRCVKGAIFWNVDRKNYNKSRLNKIAGHKLYKMMTVRNVNTVRFLSEFKD